ncbi:MAG: hypothetical protein AB7V58_13295 [Solirubrobacterales bacterium]
MSTATGVPAAWEADASESVNSLALSPTTLHAAGDFEEIDGEERQYLAAIDRLSGEATGWDPNPSSSVADIAVSASTVYAAGLSARSAATPNVNTSRRST